MLNNTYLVKEWVSGKRYYSADVDFHPLTFPYRANPTRSIDRAHAYDDMAPHTVFPSHESKMAGKRIFAEPAQKARQSSRIRDYNTSGNIDLRDIPDVAEPPATSMSVMLPANGAFSIHNFGPDPENMTEARQMYDANDWIYAELLEKNSFKEHKVYEVCLRAECKGKRVFKPRPVLKRKLNPPDSTHPYGSLDKHKYRLTIAAFTKMLKQGVDYAEKYASTVRWNSIKVMLAIAAKHNYDIALVDISTFFLYGELSDAVFMEIPEGWGEDGMCGPDYIWRIKKSMYGLPQAPHCAQIKLKAAMVEGKKFTPCTSDDCMYVASEANSGYSIAGTSPLWLGTPKEFRS